jgi:hypothetical protein
MIVKIRHRDMT